MKRLLTVALRVRILGLAFLLAVPGDLHLVAQNRMDFSFVAEDSGPVALGLALRKLNVSATFMQVAAHPDDEHNGLLAMYARGMGVRTIALQTTRGDGGQNEIGPELFRDMAVLRTSELLSAHRIDGAEQYFTRAIDYGYSFDPQEVINKWGRQEIIGDFVRLIRTLRPDVFLTMNIQGRGGDRAHESTTILSREAFRAAGDPNQFPEQIRQGLRPWQPRKLYFTGAFGGGGGGGRGGRGGNADAPPPKTPPPPPEKLARPNTAMYDPLLGRTYAEIGADARSSHKCQGMGGVPPLPGSGGGRGPNGYKLMETSISGQMDKNEASLFDGVDISLTALANFAGANPPAALTSALATISDHAKQAQGQFAAGNQSGVATAVEAGLAGVRALRAQLASLGLNDAARYELDFRLRIKERDYEDAVLAAHDTSFEAIADDGLVIRGQPVKLNLVAVNHGPSEVRVTSVAIAGFDSPGNCAAGPAQKETVYHCAADARIPRDAKLTTPYFSDAYWSHPANPAIDIFDPDVEFGIPFRPTPFRATFHVKAGSAEVTKEVAVQFRYIKDTYFGDKRMELNVVPAYSVKVTPGLAVIPASTGPAAKAIEREVHVTVTNGIKGAAQVNIALELPAGWKAVPANMPLRFLHEDESLSARFQITTPPQVKVGEYALKAVVTSPSVVGEKFENGYHEIEYPHVERRQVIKPAQATLKVVDVKVAPGVNVGYIVGVGDQVPAALEQLGAKVTFIDQDELAWGNLAKYDVILTGVRAYERRGDLRAYNRRLLDYVERGGTVIVQYNKMEFNQAEYGPYEAKVSGDRVSDETVAVKVLVPNDPVFNYPNKIGASTWQGWVQERGLYFLGKKDSKYVDLVSMVDSYPDNPGVKLGSFVEGKFGKGRWMYLALGLWRQLPAGTDGAYQLLANLISRPKAPATVASK